jgi:hypothetical protein
VVPEVPNLNRAMNRPYKAQRGAPEGLRGAKIKQTTFLTYPGPFSAILGLARVIPGDPL